MIISKLNFIVSLHNHITYENKMILKSDVFPIGQLTKTHGLKGEMTFSCTSTILEDAEIPFIILEPEGILVPFYIDEVRLKTDETGLISFERIETEEKAREYLGLTMFLPNEYLEEIKDTQIEADYFVGFEVIDEEKGKIGKITEVDQSTANVLFIVETDTDDVLIPAVDEFITDIDHDKKIIRLNLPDGLLEL